MLLLVTWFVALAFLSNYPNGHRRRSRQSEPGFIRPGTGRLFRGAGGGAVYKPAAELAHVNGGPTVALTGNALPSTRTLLPIGSRRPTGRSAGNELGATASALGQITSPRSESSVGRARVRLARPGAGWARVPGRPCEARRPQPKPRRAGCSAPETRLAAAFARGIETTRGWPGARHADRIPEIDRWPQCLCRLRPSGLARTGRSASPSSCASRRTGTPWRPCATVMASLHPDLTVFDVHTIEEDLDRMNSLAQWESRST